MRLLTLLGPGGTGKTRLALQAAAAAADRYPDGVFWIALAPLRDPGLVLEAASQALGASDGLVDHVADKRLLLLLDNFEHLIAAAGELAELLRSCPNLSLVVTSRELLQLAAEQSYPVPPLEPQDGVQLFVARARAVEPAFEPDEAVPALCDRLDNPATRARAGGGACSNPLAATAARALDGAARPAEGGPRRRSAAADAASDDRVEP